MKILYLLIPLILSGCATNSHLDSNGAQYRKNCIDTYKLEDRRDEICDTGAIVVTALKLDKLPKVAPLRIDSPGKFGYYFSCLDKKIGTVSQCENDARAFDIITEVVNGKSQFNQIGNSTRWLNRYLESEEGKYSSHFISIIEEQYSKLSDWKSRTHVDPLTDEESTSIYSQGRYYYYGDKNITLSINKNSSGEYISVNTNDFLTNNSNPFKSVIRVDDNKPVELIMTTWSNNSNGGYTRDVTFIKELKQQFMHGKTAFVRAYSWNGVFYETEISLQGFTKALESL